MAHQFSVPSRQRHQQQQQLAPQQQQHHTDQKRHSIAPIPLPPSQSSNNSHQPPLPPPSSSSQHRSSSAAPAGASGERSRHYHHHHHNHHYHNGQSSEPTYERRSAHSVPPSAPSSASGSKSSSFIGTPRLLSRRSSTRDGTTSRPAMPVARTESVSGKPRQEPPAPSEAGSPEEEVIETAELRLDRDPETGRKMINQYLVMEEIGHGTHGRVRLGRDMSVDVSPDELEADLATGQGPFYAIKIVERNPKKKRLAGLGRQRALARSGGDAGKLVAENEIRKEIAIVKKLHHPNVVRMKEIIDDPDSSKLFMIFEYCEGGEVRWKTDTGLPALTLAETRNIFRDVLLGLQYLHHQGIIHRDIKPSNLLRSGDKIKISDFGCSHFSEQLLCASNAGGEESYVDDIDLAKTAGSPAFFAPEMCYSDIADEPKRTNSATNTAATAVSPEARLQPNRSESTMTIPRKPRLPITNAIDVWALGVTLYCLFFGKTPFDAANEYLLMQAIPTAQYEIPATLSRDALPTDGSNEEANEALDLLARLLEKDATHRILLDQAKHHPFTLRGLSDPEGWLASTDPHAESYVTVTSDEVSAAVTRTGSIREKFRRGFNSISRRLGFGRHRSYSNADGGSDANGEHSHYPESRRVASDQGAPAPAAPSLARRLSILSRAQSPRPGLLASQLDKHAGDEHLRPAGSNDATPRQTPSFSSFDKARSDVQRTDSPGRSVPRRQSSDVITSGEPRSRTGSNASSSAGSVLGALGRNIFARGGGEGMHKTRSQRSANGSNGTALRSRGYTQSSEETDNNVFASSFASSADAFPRPPSSEILRGRSFDELGRRRSVETFEPSSPSSHGHHSGLGHVSPERVAWPSSFRDRDLSVRRGSALSGEDIRPVMEDEEVDWEGMVPDSDESDDEADDEVDGLPMGHGLSSAPADWNLSHCIDALERRERLRHSPMRATAARSILRPGAGVDFNHLRSHSGSPHRPPPSAFASHSSSVRTKSPLSPHDPAASGTSLAPSASVSSASSPALGGVHTAPHVGAVSSASLGIAASATSLGGVAAAASASSPLGGVPTAAHVPSTPLRPRTPSRTGASTPAAPSTPDAFADAPDDDDGIVIAARGRRGSALSRGNSMRRGPSAPPTPQPPPLPTQHQHQHSHLHTSTTALHAPHAQHAQPPTHALNAHSPVPGKTPPGASVLPQTHTAPPATTTPTPATVPATAPVPAPAPAPAAFTTTTTPPSQGTTPHAT